MEDSEGDSSPPAGLLENLVIDSGAIIKGCGFDFHKVAARFWTVQEVLAEIRDSKSLHLLETLPFELEVRTPSEAAMKAVAEFARKTNDFAALSLTDLKLIALTYQFELEANGTKYIRTEPVSLLKAKANASAANSAVKTVKVVASKALATAPAVPVVAAVLKASTAAVEEHKHAVEGCCDHDHSNDDVAAAAAVTNNVDEWDVVMGKGEKKQQALLQAQQLAWQQKKEQKKKNKQAKQAEQPVAPVTAVTATVAIADDSTTAGTQANVNDSADQDEQPAEQSEPADGLLPAAGPAAVGPATGSWAAIAAAKKSAAAPTKIKPTYIKIDDTGSGSVKKDHATATTTAADINSTSGGLSHFLSSSLSISNETTTTAIVAAGGGGGDNKREEIHSRILSHSGGNTVQSSLKSAEEDDGQGWVNPDNFRKYRAVGGNMTMGVDQTASAAVEELPEEKVACITTDFSMQNVMLQMGLHVISVDGMMIKSVKQWVLRCMACYTIHYEMDRLFCSKCGAHHMSRVGASIDARTGELRLHLKKNYRVDKSGQKFSLPAPGSRGRYEGELLLREDQLLAGIWHQKTVKIRKDVASHFGDDVTSDLGIHVNKGAAIVVGVGKKNPNASKGRERRGKKASHSVFGY